MSPFSRAFMEHIFKIYIRKYSTISHLALTDLCFHPSIHLQRFSPSSQQTLSLAQGRPTTWFEMTTPDFNLANSKKLKKVGAPPHAIDYLLELNELYLGSNTFPSRFHMGLLFDIDSLGPKIWRNQEEQIQSFVENVYRKLTDEKNPFANTFTRKSGIDAMAFGGKSLKELIAEMEE